MNAISNVQATATAIWLTIALLSTGCDSSPDLLKATDEYPIIITEEDTNRDRLDELFAEFTATYGFIRQARRHPVLGTLTGFTQFGQVNSNASASPIPLEPTREKWSEAELLEGVRQFLIKWHELFGLDPTTLADQKISYRGRLSEDIPQTSSKAGYYDIHFKQRIDNYLPAPFTSWAGVSDDGFIWFLDTRFLPNVPLPRVKDSPSSRTLNRVRDLLLTRTLGSGHCGRLYVTQDTPIRFNEIRLYLPRDSYEREVRPVIEIRVIYHFILQDALPDPDGRWNFRADFDAVTGEFIRGGYNFGCL
jgi:hypothetical protein